MIGTELGNFVIKAPLGEGGMGEVFVAEHRVMGRKVAIKLLRPQYSVDAAVVERLFNEARDTSMISHPGIVQIFDCGVFENRAYLVMELLEGQSLRDLIGVGPIDAPLAVAPRACAPYLCGPDACTNTCSGDDQCATGANCVMGKCRHPAPTIVAVEPPQGFVSGAVAFILTFSELMAKDAACGWRNLEHKRCVRVFRQGQQSRPNNRVSQFRHLCMRRPETAASTGFGIGAS